MHSDNTGFRLEITLGSAMVELKHVLHLDALLQAVGRGVHGLQSDGDVPMASKLFFHNAHLEGATAQEKKEMTYRLNSKRGWTRKMEFKKLVREGMRKDGLLTEEFKPKKTIKVDSGDLANEGKDHQTLIAEEYSAKRLTYRPQTGSGRTKNYGGENAFLQLVHYTHAVAWGVGDLNVINTLIEGITHIGGTRRNGHGLVIDIKVVTDDAAYDHWKCRTLPMDMPVADPDDYTQIISCIKGPYWLPEGRQIAKIYTSECPDKDLTSN